MTSTLSGESSMHASACNVTGESRNCARVAEGDDVTFFIEAFYPLSHVLLDFLNKPDVPFMPSLDSPPSGGGRQHCSREHKSHMCHSTGSGKRVQTQHIVSYLSLMHGSLASPLLCFSFRIAGFTSSILTNAWLPINRLSRLH
jgi:hypothetical protein